MIEFRDVSFRYGGDEKGAGVRGIDLHVKKGELLVFCGGSGCGKTTITRMLNGLIPSYYEGELDGRISIGGKDMKNAGIYDFSGKVGSVFQNPRSQFFCVEAMDEMAFACENLMFEKERTIQSIGSVCMEFNIENLVKNNLFELSGGEKQKIACASVAVMDPDIYVLDEPSSNLDIGAIEDLKKVVSRWKAEGKTVIVSEHRLYWLSDIADRFVYMEKGRIDRIFTNEEFSKMNDGERHDMGLRSFDPFVFNVERKCPPCGGFMEIEGFRFGCKRRKLVDVDRLSLPKNGIFGILGDNGAGKSSFAKVLCGLERKCRGNLVRSGGKLNAKGRLQNSYMVMQDVNHQLFTDSVMEEVLLSMEGGDEDGKRRIAEGILADFNLFDKKDMHPMSLSGGEKQRVAIASAVASSRDIVVLDEPTSGLDYENMKEVASHIRDMRESGKSVFIITHDPELLYRCCDHILFIDGGKIKWHGQLDLETATRINRDFFKRR